MTPYLLIVILCIISTSKITAQEALPIFAVDSAPVLTACAEPKDTKDCFNEGMSDFAKRNFVTRKTMEAGGTAYVQFVVSKEGEVGNIRVRSNSKDQKKDIIRILSTLKFNSPALLDGEPVAMKHSMPIVFTTTIMDSYEDFFKSKAKDLPLASELAFPPLYKECTSQKNPRKCFERTTEEKIKDAAGDAKRGSVFNYFFEIDENGKTTNVIVLSHNAAEARKKVLSSLEKLNFQAAAKNQTGEFVKSYFSGKLVL
ncbi:energy transducer TonB [Salinimicrobium sp. GXAS 041]|uniref:energy transducer TonB n=1 Tax=Salinimicrobium sp. GXAS 041 TaxID=3400806 RepID=UPI003C75C213